MEAKLRDIAALLRAELAGDGEVVIRGAAPFETASGDQLTYAGSSRFLRRIDETDAGAILVPRGFEAPGRNLLRVDNPELTFLKLLDRFVPKAPPRIGIDPTACTGQDVEMGRDVYLGPHVVIGDRVRLGDRVKIAAGTFIGDDVQMGDDVEIWPNVTILERCRIGSRVRIQAATVIGSIGFGYVNDGERYHPIPHTGIVQIDDDVDIGAGNTIDRATFGRTWIQSGVKTDNQVHIAHNVTVGSHTVMAAQAGVSGSVTIGSHCILAGQSGVSQHLTLGDRVIVGPQAGLAKSVPEGQIVSGSPEMPHRTWLKVHRIIPRLPEFRKQMADLEKRLKALEAAAASASGEKPD